MIAQAVQRAQAYLSLSHAFLYPQENWLEDLPLLAELLEALNVPLAQEAGQPARQLDLAGLQAHHRDVFGLAGSLCYETEFGLPHEFRQSQELADIAGFYRAFGFQVGAAVRERPDHLAAELEFMYLLALKEAYAAENLTHEQVEICLTAQRRFLEDHLGRWIGPFRRALELLVRARLGDAGVDSPYLWLAHRAEAFVLADADRLGAAAVREQPGSLQPTPFDPDFTCAGCAAAEPLP
jgi:nitrate reductase assembly molybdenum cofactor insertion protein NarJ